MSLSSTNNEEIYSATLEAVGRKFDGNMKLTKVHKPKPLTLDRLMLPPYLLNKFKF